jgi:hypothetical protein
MSAESRPPWAKRYLAFDAWTQHELRNLLCGFPPQPPDDTPIPATERVPTREENAARYMREEPQRVDADRHIRDAVIAGQLKVLDPADERLLSKLTALAPHELDVLRRAIAHERACAKSYVVAPKEAIRWATRSRALFPRFPFSRADLVDSTPEGTSPDERKTLREHRSRLVTVALQTKGLSRSKFCQNAGISPDKLRAVINADPERAS